jgi:hypothetical protein
VRISRSYFPPIYISTRAEKFPVQILIRNQGLLVLFLALMSAPERGPMVSYLPLDLDTAKICASFTFNKKKDARCAVEHNAIHTIILTKNQAMTNKKDWMTGRFEYCYDINNNTWCSLRSLHISYMTNCEIG